MNLSSTLAGAAGQPPTRSSSSAGSVFLPKEHGSWSLALEPVVLGLLIAPSMAGLALACASVTVLFLRRPFKAALGSAGTDRRGPAGFAFVVLASFSLIGLGEAFLFASPQMLWPLLVAVPFCVLYGYFDGQGDSRAAAAELSGSAAFAVLPLAFATLAGWPASAALALAALALIRSIPTVLTVRGYLRMSKSRPFTPAVPLSAAALGFSAGLLLAAHHLVPWLAAGVSGLLLARTAWLISPWRPIWTARRIGMTEAALGAAYVIVVALAYRT